MPSPAALDPLTLDLVERALTLPESQRKAWLEAQCENNIALSQRAQELLALVTTSDGWLATGGASALAAHAGGLRDHPSRVGNYQIVDLLGQGGMGVVYRAQRDDGVFDHEVAIKFLNTSALRQSALVGFSAERQILANLQDPNIAQLLDGGELEGCPYLVMEYVDGVPLAAQPQLQQTLEVFLQLCKAVRFAHSNGVIHRDIKPSNVLVTQHSQVKLLDFGVAKLAEPFEAEGGHTAGLTMGETPITRNYAAPEILAGHSATTASDVYSLGVVLFELLHGQRPYDISGIPLAQAAAQVTEHTGRLPILGKAATSDLDSIVHVAMHSDPARRYGSVAALMDDIQRFEQHKPISARMDDRRYLLRQFIKRNKPLVLVSAVSAVAVVAALVAVSTALLESRQQQQLASIEAANAQGAVEFIKAALQSSNPFEAGKPDATIADALTYVEERLASEFGDNPDNQVFLLNAVGEIYVSRGDYAKAKAAGERAVAVIQSNFDQHYHRLPMAWRVVSYSELNAGKFQAALAAATESLQAAQLQFEVEPNQESAGELAHALHVKARALLELDDLDQAAADFRQALELRQNQAASDATTLAASYTGLSALEMRRRDFIAAKPLQEEALRYTRLVTGYEQQARYYLILGNYGVILSHLADLEGAQAAHTEANIGTKRVLGEDHPFYVSGLVSLAIVYERQERYREGIALLEPRAQALLTATDVSVGGAYLLARLGGLMCQAERAEQGLEYAKKGYQARVAIYTEAHVLAQDSLRTISYCQLKIGLVEEAYQSYQELRANLVELRGEAFAEQITADLSAALAKARP